MEKISIFVLNVPNSTKKKKKKINKYYVWLIQCFKQKNCDRRRFLNNNKVPTAPFGDNIDRYRYLYCRQMGL